MLRFQMPDAVTVWVELGRLQIIQVPGWHGETRQGPARRRRVSSSIDRDHRDRDSDHLVFSKNLNVDGYYTTFKLLSHDIMY